MNEKQTGLELIVEERNRQRLQEGYTLEHDLNHTVADLTSAALAYVFNAEGESMARHIWPWDKSSFKPTTPVRDLVKAGALIAAAIDRALAEEPSHE